MVLVGTESPPPPPPSLGRRAQDGGGISLSSSSSSSSAVVDSVGLRRPRNREVLSRYKSASLASSSSPGSVPVPVSASSRRFLSPHKTPPGDDKGDGDGGVRGVVVSKRAQSTERRRLPSPIRDTKPPSSSASSLVSASASASVVAARRARPAVRAELFWPSSQSMSASMIAESIPRLNKSNNNKNNTIVGVSKSRAASTERRRPAASSSVTPSPSPSPLPVRPKPAPPSNGALTGSTRTELFRPHSTDRRRPTTPANGTPNNSRPSPTPSPSPSPSVRSDLFWPSSQTAATPEPPPPSSKSRPHSSTERQRRPPSPSPSPSPSSKPKPPSNSLFSPHTSADQTLKPSANIIASPQSVHHPHHHQQQPPSTPTHHRKGTPERKGTPTRRLSLNQAENAKPSSENIQSRPGHAKSFTLSASPVSMSRSVDLTSEREKHHAPSHNSSSSTSRASASRVVIPRPLLSSSRSLSQSINEGPTSSYSSRRVPPDIKTQRRTPTPTRECRDSAVQRIATTSNATISCRERRAASIDGTESVSSEINGASLDMASDTESTSSASTVNTPSTSGRGGGVSSKAPRGTAVPARFWQDAVNRSAARRLSENGNRPRGSATETELSSTATSGKVGARQKLAASSSDARLPSSSMSPSPFSSPQKATKMLPASPSRGFPSPTRSRPLPTPPPSSLPSTSANIPSPALSSASSVMMNFGVDARKGKRGVNQLEEAHFHRILHNRLLHWRFVNARAQASMNAQIVAAQKQLYGVWVKTAELRASVTAKKIKLQQARQAQIVNLILSGQVSLLDGWTTLRPEHLSALGGVVEALEAATLRVPVTAGVRADTRAVKEALSSAVDVMNALKSATTFLLPKAEKVNISVSELAQVADQERILLEECGDSMAVISAFEIEERSLSIHLIEGEQEKARVLGHLMDSAIGPSVLF